MAEFVKKTALGYKAVQGGQSDYDCTGFPKSTSTGVYSPLKFSKSFSMLLFFIDS